MDLAQPLAMCVRCRYRQDRKISFRPLQLKNTSESVGPNQSVQVWYSQNIKETHYDRDEVNSKQSGADLCFHVRGGCVRSVHCSD
jgi:hypothetical protein